MKLHPAQSPTPPLCVCVHNTLKGEKTKVCSRVVHEGNSTAMPLRGVGFGLGSSGSAVCDAWQLAEHAYRDWPHCVQ